MRLRIWPVLVLPLLVAATAHTRPSPWPAMAERDLRAIHDAIRDNHPGPVDPENPHFRDWLEAGLSAAAREAAGAKSYSDYVRAVRRYTNGFQDGHVSMDFTVAPRAIEWTGFVAGDRGDGEAAILYAEPDSGVKAGDRVEGCDGRSLDAMMKARVDPYFWNSAIPHARMRQVQALFVANPDEKESRPLLCRFSSGEVRLSWRSRDSGEYYKLFNRALSGDSDFAIRQVDGIWFVRLPRFWLMADDDLAKLNALVAELKTKAAALRGATIVFDVRGNGGGNSLWGTRFASALWGDDWVEWVEAGFDSRHDVRVSPANIRKVAEIVDTVKKRNMTEALPYWTTMLERMHAAAAAGQPFVRMGEAPTPPSGPAPPNPVSGRVFLLTDAGCASACLDFADLMLRLPGVTQIGLPTYADAVYIDVNQAELPSGLGRLDYGMKVFRHRVRANNQ